MIRRCTRPLPRRPAAKRVRPLLAAACLVAASLCSPAHGQGSQRIAAIVNDEVITTYDIDQRVKLTASARGREVPANLIERVREQALEALINEHLQVQAADRNGIEITDTDVDNGLQRIAQRNQIGPQQLVQRLEQFGVQRDTIREQIRAELAWTELVRRRFASRVSVSPDQVDAVYQQIASQGGGVQYRLAEIFLSKEAAGGIAGIQATLQEIQRQLQGGTAFDALAREFSAAASASNGGDTGWIERELLPDPVAEAADQLQKGRLAGPIETDDGFYVIAMVDKRETPSVPQADPRLTLKQIVVPLAANADEEGLRAARAAARSARARIDGCESVDEIKEDFGPLSGDLGTLTLSELPQAFQRAVASLETTAVSEPVRTENGLHLLVLCDREAVPVDQAQRERIQRRLLEQQVTRMAQRYLRNLRRDATIDIRL